MSLQSLWLVLQQQPNLALLAASLLSLLVGSFLNVVIYRLPLSLHAQWQQDANAIMAQADNTVNEVRP